MTCSNNIKQLGIATHSFNDANGKLPPAWTADSGGGTLGSNAAFPAGVTGTAHYLMLPYIEQDNVYRLANNNASNQASVIIKTFLCPSDSTLSSNLQRYNYASTNYATNLMVFNPKGPGDLVTSMPDGTSNTVIFAERYKRCEPSSGGYTGPGWAMHPAYVGHAWDTPSFGFAEMGHGHDPDFTYGSLPFQIAPQASACTWQVTQSAHTGSMQVGLGDGSVRGVSSGMSVTTWDRACRPNDGQQLGSDW
jgi:hypothetical protein